MLVLGSQNSSNSQRLAELARESGKRAYLIDGAADIDLGLVPRRRDGAGHGRRELRRRLVVEECLEYLARRSSAPRSNCACVREEEVYFPLPRELRSSERQRDAPGSASEPLRLLATDVSFSNSDSRHGERRRTAGRLDTVESMTFAEWTAGGSMPSLRSAVIVSSECSSSGNDSRHRQVVVGLHDVADRDHPLQFVAVHHRQVADAVFGHQAHRVVDRVEAASR